MKNISLLFRHVVLIIIIFSSICFNDYAFSLDDTEWKDSHNSPYHDGFFNGDSWTNSGDGGETWNGCTSEFTYTASDTDYIVISKPSMLVFGLGLYLKGTYSLSTGTRNEKGLVILFFIPLRSPREDYTLVSENFNCVENNKFSEEPGLRGDNSYENLFTRFKTFLESLEPIENGLDSNNLQNECVEMIETLRKNKKQIGSSRFQMAKSNLENSLEVAEILASNAELNYRASNVINELISTIKNFPSENSFVGFFKYSIPMWLEDDIKTLLDDIAQFGSADLKDAIKKSWEALYE